MPNEDMAGNGVYCAAPSEAGKAHYAHTAIPNMLRYEVMLSSTHSKEAADDGSPLPEPVYSWIITRVTRSLSGRKTWVGVPVQQAASSSNATMPTADWVALKKKVLYNLKTDETTHGMGYEFDHAQTAIEVTPYAADAQFSQALHAYEVAVGEEDASLSICIASTCLPTPLLSPTENIDLPTLHVASLVTMLTHDHPSTLAVYGAALKRLEGSGATRAARHAMAMLYQASACALTKQGNLAEGVKFVVKGLGAVPNEIMRRSLFVDLGDLYVATGDIEKAKQSYVAAKEAVRTKGNRVDVTGFSARVSEYSVGGVLGRVLGQDYARVRNGVMMGNSADDFKDSVAEWVEARQGAEGGGSAAAAAPVCEDGEVLIEGGLIEKFCRKYEWHRNVGAASGGGGDSSGEAERNSGGEL
jgi:hypothetical protein